MIYPDGVSDYQVWPQCQVDHLWIYDKLILARKLGHCAGPAGLPPPTSDWYVVRPTTNLRMMSRGARVVWLTQGQDSDQLVPDGYFWSQRFHGPHWSIDYHWGQPVLAVQGFRDDPLRLDRFSSWQRVNVDFELPDCLQNIAQQYEWFNVEAIGSHVIEVHLRYNDDWQGVEGNAIYPVWRDWPTQPPPCPSAVWMPNECGDRLGFWAVP
jgi:hypothetical protein